MEFNKREPSKQNLFDKKSLTKRFDAIIKFFKKNKRFSSVLVEKVTF